MTIPEKLTDICPECSAESFTYAEQYEEESDEALYSCDNCSARVWIYQEEAIT